jgi:hypothetical protein
MTESLLRLKTDQFVVRPIAAEPPNYLSGLIRNHAELVRISPNHLAQPTNEGERIHPGNATKGTRSAVSSRVKVTGDLFHGLVPDGAVYVGRAAPGLRKSPYANPFPVKTYGLTESLRRYQTHAETFDLAAVRRDLTGKDLACWCPLDQPCHADVLLELANP